MKGYPQFVEQYCIPFSHGVFTAMGISATLISIERALSA